jgi:hypothetical protein
LTENTYDQNTYDHKIRVVKTHQQGTGSIEFCIPKELCERYSLTEPALIMLIPDEDHFKVMRLQLYGPENSKK